MPSVASLSTRTKRRWDALAADQLRVELEKVAAERDDLFARVRAAEQAESRASCYAFGEEMHRAAIQDQIAELLLIARRAGISLRVPPVGMTRGGMIGLQVAS